jgi:hypothetical protein
MSPASVIFKTLLKANNHPIDKNSPNLVTLMNTKIRQDRRYTKQNFEIGSTPGLPYGLFLNQIRSFGTF